MKRSFWDIIKREYEVRFSVSSRDTISPLSEQKKGISVLSPKGEEVFLSGNTAAVEETFALIRELHPEVMRFFGSGPDFERWLDFCPKEGISPHIVFPLDADPIQLRTAAERCISIYAEHGLQESPRYYEIVPDAAQIPPDDDNGRDSRIRKMKECAGILRTADPDSRIILGGITPIGIDSGRSDVWNTALIEQCADVMDMIGITLHPSAVSGRGWEENDEGIEADFAMAEEIRTGLQRLERQIRRFDPDTGIRIAVTGWGFLPDSIPQKRQDCVFFSSVYKSLRMGSGIIGLMEAGPLFGNNGLLRFEDGKVFGDVLYHNLLITSPDLPICLEVKEAENEKPCPIYHWDGIPGTFDGADMKLLDIYASRSRDGKKLFLLLTNRTPFKRAIPRVRFYELPDMHPVRACSIRSGKRQDGNSAAAPLNVFCKEVKLRKYRNMDHVTLDILQCTAVCMLLEE